MVTGWEAAGVQRERKDHSFIVIADVKDDALQALHYVAPSAAAILRPVVAGWGRDCLFEDRWIRGEAAADSGADAILEHLDWGFANIQVAGMWKGGKASRDSLPHFATESLQFASGEPSGFDSEADGWNHLYSIRRAEARLRC